MADRTDFDAALSTIRENPADEATWDIALDLAAQLELPDDVAALFQEVLAENLSAEVADQIGQCASGFYEEWFGDEPGRLSSVLIRVLELSPGADWAFQRATMALTMQERWDDLFGLYDSAAASANTDDDKIRILEEASQTARDMAGNADKAIDYLKALLPLRPEDEKLAANLERLLAKNERWQELIDTWEFRLERLSDGERRESRQRIATCYLESLGAHDKALEAAKEFLGEDGDDKDACGLIERIGCHPDASPAVRSGALDLLRYQFESTGRQRDIVRVIEAILEVDNRDERDHRQEAAQILADLGEHNAAMGHYALLLRLEPSSTAYFGHLEQLAAASENYEGFAAGVRGAAEGAEDPSRKVALLSAAASARLSHLEDETGAIEIWTEALAVEGIAGRDVLRVGRRLNELLADTDRPADRLAVVERLADAETVRSTQRALVADIARLAEKLGDGAKALAAWKRRLEADPADAVALDGMIDLLEREELWGELVPTLKSRIGNAAAPAAKRADMVRLAGIHSDRLSEDRIALEVWQAIQSEFGETDETADALCRFMGATERWDELAALLERASERQTTGLLARLAALSTTYLEQLGDPRHALRGFSRVLRIAPDNQEARDGLLALSNTEGCEADATEVLAEMYRATDDWDGILSLVEPRLAQAQEPRERLNILREAAKLHETKRSNPEAALAAVCQAFPLSPADSSLLGKVVELARGTGEWGQAADAHRAALEQVGDDVDAATELHGSLATILEKQLNDAEGAISEYRWLSDREPGNRDAANAIARLGTGLGRWDEVAQVAVRFFASRGRVEEGLVSAIENSATEAGQLESMVNALWSAVEGEENLSAPDAATLWWRLALWCRDTLEASDRAEQALSRVIERDMSRIDAVRALAELQRDHVDASLYPTLNRLIEIEPNNIDLLREVVEVARDHVGDVGELEKALKTLLARSGAMWSGSVKGESSQPAEEVVAWAMTELENHYVATQSPSKAFELLVDAARLPFDDAGKRNLRVRAAAIAGEQLGDSGSAIEMFRSVLSQAPDDTEALSKLGDILRSEDRPAELFALCQHELGLSPSAERRLELRLEMADVVAKIEAIGGQVKVLRENLDESPGHSKSLERLSQLLVSRTQHTELAELYGVQAERVQKAGDGDRAAELWTRLAMLSETDLLDSGRSIDAHRRAVALVPAVLNMDALARLYTDAELHDQAVPWLQKLFQSEEAPNAALALRLANGHLGAGDLASAETVLAGWLETNGDDPEVRGKLLGIYRDCGSWEPLADLLSTSLGLLSDSEDVVAYAREATEIYHHKVDKPAKAIAALRQACELNPDDRELKLQLAISLRHAGDIETARGILETMITDFGRRRSKERAAVHVELAYVARAEGNHDAALKEVDLAARMDVGNPKLLRQSAELALSGGNVDKAEKSLRALLLLVRRQPPGDDLAAVGESEVLYELHHIAKERGDENAGELLGSALEAASQSDTEVKRLCRMLGQMDTYDIAEKALEMRLEQADEVGSKSWLLTELAEVFERDGARGEAALERRLQALAFTPDRLDLHTVAIERADALGKLSDYVGAVSGLLDGFSRDEDAALVAELSMTLGALCEERLRDLGRAHGFYARAEATECRVADALFATARVAGELGNDEEGKRALSALSTLATAGEPSPDQADALYRLAQMQVTYDDHRAEGVEMLKRALSIAPRHDVAAEILRAVLEAQADNAEVLAMYESAARGSGNWEILIDFAERRANRPEATPDQIKEAVDIAVENEVPERGAALLERAVDAARASEGGLASALWAVGSLVTQKIDAGDLAGAGQLVYEAADIADPALLKELGVAVARGAVEGDNIHLGAEMYEFLRKRTPQDRDIWEPQLALYCDAGSEEGAEALVAATLPVLVSPDERNALRRRHAGFIHALGKSDAAVELLRDTLLDNPEDLEASALLEKVLRDSGNTEGLSQFLWNQFEDAKQRDSASTIVEAAARLGSLLDELQDPQASEVYRAALALAPTSPALLRAVLRYVPEDEYFERGEIMTRLLEVETEADAPSLAIALSELWNSVVQPEGALRALQTGFRRAPTDPSLGERLENHYRQYEMWGELGELMVTQASELDDGALAVARFREAATLYREQLEDLVATARVLKLARDKVPGDDALVADLADALAAAGDVAGAAEAISDALADEFANEIGDAGRLALLLKVAGLHQQQGDTAAAVGALELAHEIDSGQAGLLLTAALAQHVDSSRERGNTDAERSATLRLAALWSAQDLAAEACQLLAQWGDAHGDDVEALEQLRVLGTQHEQWSSVVTACSNLVRLTANEEQRETAVALGNAATAVGDPSLAQGGLEVVIDAQPAAKEIRDYLRELYEAGDAKRKLATLLLIDAEHADSDDERYQSFRRSADIFVNDLDDADAAIAPAQQAQELRPEDHDTLLLVADVMTASGKPGEAAAVLEPAIGKHKRRSPKLAALQYRMAKVAAASDDQQGQLGWLKKAFDVDRKNGVIAAELAQLATQLQDYDLALKPLRAISLMDTDGPISRTMALLWEAKIEHARGNRAKAELWAKKALREDPEFAEAQQFLAEIAE